MSAPDQKLFFARKSDSVEEALEFADAPKPDPGPGEIVVRNAFAGVNGIFDAMYVAGRIGYVPFNPPTDAGIEAVGQVAAVGAGVSRFKEGDAVAVSRLGFGYRHWGIATETETYAIPDASAEILTLVPTGISALIALERVGELKSNETVVVTAAAGGLGHIALQVAKLAGNHVIAICGGEAKGEAAKQLGADRVIDYKSEDVGTVLANHYPNGIDIAYDSVGGALFDTLVDNIAVHGRLVSTGHAADMLEGGPFDVTAPRVYTKLYWKAASIRAYLNAHFREHHRDAATRLIELHQSRDLKVLVDPTPFKGLESVADAINHLTSGKNIGKVVVDLR